MMTIVLGFELKNLKVISIDTFAEADCKAAQRAEEEEKVKRAEGRRPGVGLRVGPGTRYLNLEAALRLA